MLLWGSFTLIILITGIVVYFSHKWRYHLTLMSGMVISMTNAMLSSIAIGTLIGIFLLDKDLTIPTVISVTFGIIVGYTTGRPMSVSTALEGMTAGIMGGMMGAMLGVMTSPEHKELIIFFIDIIYLIVNIMLFRVISEELKIKSLVEKFLILLTFIIFVGFIVYLNLNIFIN